MSMKIIENLDWNQISKSDFLELSGVNLSVLPTELFKLDKLKSLDLSNNQIKIIPSAIKKLKELRYLDLSKNSIKYFPKEILELSKLETLVIDSNNIKKIPNEILLLKSLKKLSVLSNPIEFPPPEIVLKENCRNSVFTFYETLEKESFERDEIVGKWKDIIVKTNIEHSFKRIFEESKDNQKKLKEVIEAFSKLKKTNEFEFEFEELLKTSKELTKKHKLFEAKLIVVGEERAGKSSLVKAISHNNYKLDLDELSTQGINITHWTLDKKKIKNSNDFTLNVWDFGGQEIYHATHQFFLTKRSVYLLVTEARKDIRHEDFYYWLNIIKHLGGNSPIVIVTNKIDQPNTGIGIDEFKTLFPNIIEEHKVSCLEAYRPSIDNLVDGIIKVVKNPKLLPHVGTELPKVYVDIKSEINQLKEKGVLHFSFNSYMEICKRYGLNNSQSIEICEFFHDLGVFLHFDNDDPILKKTIFLNFEWVTKAVYNVLDNQEIIDNNGYFTNDNLESIWHEPLFLNKYKELLALMKNKKFDLCFEIDKNKFLAPQLLPHNAPKYKWNSMNNTSINYEVRYKFMPKGIASRLIVRLNKLISDSLYWRYGVILEDKKSKALIRELYFERKLTVKLTGKNSKKLLDIIRNNIIEINSEFTNLDFEEMIPCSCEVCNNRNNDIYFFRLRDLVRFKDELKRKTKECGNSGIQVKIQALLSGTLLKTNQYFGNNSSRIGYSKKKTINMASGKSIWIFVFFALSGLSVLGIIKTLDSGQVYLWASIVILIFCILGLFYLFDQKKISEKGFLKGITSIVKKTKITDEE